MKTKEKITVSGIFRKGGIYILLAAFVIICSLLSESFLKIENIFNIIKQLTPVLLIAIGQCYLIIAGQIDLASGTLVAMSGVIASLLYNSTGSVVLVILMAIVIGGLVGLINGFFVTKFKLRHS